MKTIVGNEALKTFQFEYEVSVSADSGGTVKARTEAEARDIVNQLYGKGELETWTLLHDGCVLDFVINEVEEV